MFYLKYISGSIILSLLAVMLSAQGENKYIRRGNHDFEEKNFLEAEKNYLESLNKGGKTYKGLFNLGDVYYEQKDYQQAGALFDSVACLDLDGETMSKAYYNLGNTLLSVSLDSDSLAAKALPLSVESYKNALRLNPGDTAAKYNLAYAQLMLKDQQQQQQQQNQDQNQQQQDQQDQQQDQEQDQQQQDQEQDQQEQDQQEQDQQDQQKQDQQADQQQQQSQGQQPKQISKEDAERMLEAMKNDEKKTLEKVKLAKGKGKVAKSEKDW
jgi:tetratricopeptide (TPR) repeat protein